MRQLAVAIVLAALIAGSSSVDTSRHSKSAERLAANFERAVLSTGVESKLQALLARRANEHLKFCSGEHMDIAANGWDAVKRLYPSQLGDPNRQITGGPNGASAGGLVISFPEIVALAGDFYGPPEGWDNAIAACGGPFMTIDSADCQNRATVAINSLLLSTGTDARREVPVLQNLFRTRETPIITKTPQGPTDSLQAYRHEDRNRRMAIDFSRVTRDHNNGLLPRDPPNVAIDQGIDIVADPGRFLKLASHNRDHFRENQFSERAYMIFHHKAVQHMLRNRGTAPGPAANQAFNLGLMFEAFALHFLTDSFSAGHLRTPRAKVVQLCADHESTGGIIANCMHDEDNKLGLNVRARGGGDAWRAYGDQMYADPRNAVNRNKAIEAVSLSLTEVVKAFVDGANVAPANFMALPKLPEVLENNHPPLYRAGGRSLNQLERRRSDPDVPLARAEYRRVLVCTTQSPLPGLGVDSCGDYVDGEAQRIIREFAAGRVWPNLPAP